MWPPCLNCNATVFFFVLESVQSDQQNSTSLLVGGFLALSVLREDVPFSAYSKGRGAERGLKICSVQRCAPPAHVYSQTTVYKQTRFDVSLHKL
jgi:hypothetical protein